VGVVRSLTMPDWAKLRRLLVVRLDNLGDVVMTGPALRAVKAEWPQIHLTLLANPGGAPGAALLPWVDDVWTHRAVWQDLGRLAFDPTREAGFVETLRRGRYDAALILTSFSQSPHPVAFACALAGVPVRIGQSRERGRALTFEWPGAPDALHQAERNLVLVEAAGLPVRDRLLEIRIPEQARIAARRLLAASGVTGDYVVSSPFASCQARTYDSRRFGSATRIVAERAQLPIVICGMARERMRAEIIADILGERGINLVGDTDVGSFAALIAGARLVLTNNSSALHLADALAVPQLVMYSGTELESQWAPRASPHVLLRRGTGCSPCYRFECPFNHECLEFSPEQVADAALRLLSA
jgi:ADP-heptose:LPS heptosyltransferase